MKEDCEWMKNQNSNKDAAWVNPYVNLYNMSQQQYEANW